MDQVFIDTDIALDLLTGRQPHYSFASQLFALAEKRKIKIGISSLSFSNINYILGRSLGSKQVRKILLDFKLLVTITAVDERIIHLALQSDFVDFEDAIQYFTAVQHHFPILVTRNIKDYKNAQIPVSTAQQFLQTL